MNSPAEQRYVVGIMRVDEAGQASFHHRTHITARSPEHALELAKLRSIVAPVDELVKRKDAK